MPVARLLKKLFIFKVKIPFQYLICINNIIADDGKCQQNVTSAAAYIYL